MGSIYYLNNGEKGVEETRLNWLHDKVIMPMVRNVLLPPHIKADLAAMSAPLIADIGAGSASWPVTVARELPHARIRGFDMDLSKFPTMLPSNVELGYGNVLEPFPEALQQTFDLVHLRLLVGGIEKHDWVSAARNIMSLLRPGGWVIWEETGLPVRNVLPPKPGWSKFAELSWQVSDARNMDLRMPATLNRYLSEAGFVKLDEKVFNSASDENLDGALNEMMIGLAEQSLAGIVADGSYEDMKTQEKLQSVMKDIRREFDEGSKSYWILHRVWGNKPV
ncbi:Uu.00g083030.m01.CDS01 [Anthostomella pinea]|uniref:Uu.00g083030.m01.CDS01 n=1 Tax=Anthostomella pinea TaxID=933095 RepID=A0AAI8VM40_9PEZI|nr:Uu.00g083030.m01.CDS01 [Anthostomella pinea]